MKEEKKRAVIYARVSSQSDRQSTERQVADLKDMAAREGYQVVKIYQEKCSGAVLAKDRPVLSSCIEFCREAAIPTILVTEISRIGRNALDVQNTIDELTRQGIDVHIQKYGMHTLAPNGTRNPMTSMILALLAEFASLERDMIADRLKSGRERAKARGVRMGRPRGGMTAKQLVAKYPEAVRQLRAGYRQKDVARLNGISESTVLRLSRALRSE